MTWRGDETDPNARIIMYLRISDLTDTSTSIERQFKVCSDRADQVGGTVIRTYRDEDKSGFHTYVERPGFENALADLRARAADVLIVYKVDRATRQGIPQAAEIIRIVYETGCRFISVADGIDSRNGGWELQLTITAHQAHSESKNTSVRVTDLRQHERDGGRWMGHRPYGHNVTPDRKLVPEPTEAQRVRVMVRLLTLGVSLRRVASYANRQEWDSPRWAARKARIALLESKNEPVKARKLAEKPLKHANSWSGSVVRQLVTSPTIVGLLAHKGHAHRHSVTGEVVRVGKPIIAEDDYARMRSMFGERVPVHWTRSLTPATHSKETRRPARGLLVDFLRCAECGGRMSYDTTLVRKGAVIPRYRCERRSRGGRCPGTVINGNAADSLVTQTLINRVGALDHDDPAVIAIAERWIDQQHPDRVRRRAEIEHKIKEEETFLERLEDEKLSGDGLFSGSRGEERFRKRHAAVSARLDQLERELAEIPTTDRVDVSFVEQLTILVEAWEAWSLAEQRDFVALVLEHAWVHKALSVGVRPSLDRFTFWFVGEPKPEGFDFPDVLADPLPKDEAREARDVFETEDQAARLMHEDRSGRFGA